MTKAELQAWARELRQVVDRHQRFWITVHEGPDGDSIGAALAVQRVLAARGKQAVAIRHTPFPQVFHDLPSAADMVDGQKLGELWKPEVVVAVDVGNIRRTGDVHRHLDADTTLVNIDHHPGSPGDHTAGRLLNLLDVEAASTTMVAYLLLQEAWPGCIDEGTASCLYVGLITDTGCFRFSNTTTPALRVGSELASLGADPGALAEHYMFRRRPQALQLLGAVLGTLEFHAGGRLAVLRLTREMLQRTGARMDETEGFVNYATSLEGVEVAVLLREVEPRTTKLSLRASGDRDVSRMARRFGGGGHAKAAGMTLESDLQAARDRIVEAFVADLDRPDAADTVGPGSARRPGG